MPVNATLLLLDCDLPPETTSNGRGYAYSFSMLHLHQDRVLFESIRRVGEGHWTPVPEGFGSYKGTTGAGEAGYGDTPNGGDGDPLRCLPAGVLYHAWKRRRQHASNANKAAGAWLAALPPEQRVAVYWEP